MCRSIAEGDRRCANSRRLEKLTAVKLAPSTHGAPDLDWANADLGALWAEHTPAEACVALETVELASTHDGRTFADMGAAANFAGGELHGTAFRIKSPASLARKIRDKQEDSEAKDEIKVSPAESAATITDVTRYTILSTEHDQLVPTTRAAVIDLETRGWHVVTAEQSYLSGNSYKGLHLVVRHEDGQVAELQIHSAKSQKLKDRAHVLYEISRDRNLPLSKRRDADRENKTMYEDLPAPAGLNDFDKLGSVLVSKKRYGKAK